MPGTTSPSLFLVDVFAERPYAGNPLAVVVGADPSQWPTERMHAFAREMNFSETTFASPVATDGAFDVRIFTPAEELPFAGHPTLGTAWVLHRFFHGASAPPVLSLRLKSGIVPVEIADGESGELVRMRPRSPELGAVVDGRTMAAHLGLGEAALDSRHPCRRVRIGVEFVIVPLRDLASLRAARPLSLPAGDPGRMLGVYAFAPEPCEPGADLSARMFFEALGIREDPATGSAAACLAAYLSAQRYFASPQVNVRVQQGYEVGRPSCLYIGADESGAAGAARDPAERGVPAEQSGSGPEERRFAVEVAGKVVLVARGEVA